MALPVDYQTCHVTGRWVDLLGNPVEGRVKFSVRANRIVSPATETIVVPATITVILDLNGEIDLNLPATDDPDISPVGFTYQVAEELTKGGGLSYSIAAPVGGDIDLSTVVAVNVGTGATITQGPAGGPPIVDGTVPTAGSLPGSATTGHIRIAVDTGHGWQWNGVAWVDIGVWTYTADPAANVAGARTLGTGSQQAAPGTSVVPALPGGIALRTTGVSSLADLIAGAATTPFDVVIFNDSLDGGSTTVHPWTWRFADRLAAACGTPTPADRQHLVYAKASGHPAMDACAGTLSGTTTAGWGATLTDTQTASHTAHCDAWSVVYKAGAGTLTVRANNGAGTVLGTIDTSLVTGAGNVWTSAAITEGVNTVHITSTGATTLEAVLPHLGTRTKGGRVWSVSHAGWTNLDYSATATHGLNLVSHLAPDVVIIETGTNAVTTYGAEIDDMVAAVQVASPTSLVVVIVPASSDAISQAEVDAGRTVVEGLGVPIVDWDRLIPDYRANLITDGTHPSVQGVEVFADVTWRALGGDPIGQAARDQGTPTRSQLFELLSANSVDLRLLSAWQNLGETGLFEAVMQIGADGLRIDTEGDGYFKIVDDGSQPVIQVFTTAAAAFPSLVLGSTFSVPVVVFGDGTVAPATYLTGLGGVLRAGLSGEQGFWGDSLRLGNETLALTVEADAGDASTDRLAISGEVKIDTPGDGYVLVRTASNQPEIDIYATAASAFPTVSVGTIFGLPLVALGTGAAATGSYITGDGAGLVKIGLSGDGVIQAGHLLTINAQTGTTYSVVAADAAKQITRNNASASTQTWATPTSLGLPVGTRIHTGNKGAGTITHSGGGAAGALTQTTNTEIVAVADTTSTWRLYS